jgi:hypothetical protein
MATIRLTVDVEPSELAADLLQVGGFNITEFILNLDEEIGDEAFTLTLVRKLLKRLSAESQSHAEWLAKMSLEQNFGDGEVDAINAVGDPIMIRNYAKEWDVVEEWHKKLLDVERLLSSLVELE